MFILLCAFMLQGPAGAKGDKGERVSHSIHTIRLILFTLPLRPSPPVFYLMNQDLSQRFFVQFHVHPFP